MAEISDENSLEGNPKATWPEDRLHLIVPLYVTSVAEPPTSRSKKSLDQLFKQFTKMNFWIIRLKFVEIEAMSVQRIRTQNFHVFSLITCS